MTTYNKFSKLLLIAITTFALNQTGYAEATIEESSDWKAEILSMLDEKQYDAAFSRLLDLETDNADTSADWNNLMGYTMRMLDGPDLESSEEHYIKAVELQADHRGALEYYGKLKLQQKDLEGAKKLLSRLEEVCAEGCQELDTLRKSVEDYEAENT